MIAKMAKYDFVLYAAQSEDFIEKLRELGLVDITTTGWEPSEEDRQLLLDIEGHTKAADFLRNFRAGEGRFEAGAKPFASGAEAYEHYAAAHQKATALAARDPPGHGASRPTSWPAGWGVVLRPSVRRRWLRRASCYAISSPRRATMTSSGPNGRNAIRFR